MDTINITLIVAFIMNVATTFIIKNHGKFDIMNTDIAIILVFHDMRQCCNIMFLMGQQAVNGTRIK